MAAAEAVALLDALRAQVKTPKNPKKTSNLLKKMRIFGKMMIFGKMTIFQAAEVAAHGREMLRRVRGGQMETREVPGGGLGDFKGKFWDF